jgi:hypothetical protein
MIFESNPLPSTVDSGSSHVVSWAGVLAFACSTRNHNQRLLLYVSQTPVLHKILTK